MSHWHLVVCGISHKTSSIAEREPLQLGHDEIAKGHATFSDMPEVIESTIISTCNRVEFYFVSRRNHDPFEIVRTFYDDFRQYDISDLKDRFYIKKNKHAAGHLFRVAAGIDSMVLGENQIVGQIKDAYSSACAVKAAGKVLHRLFHQAFRVGKQVRTDTEMGKGACSVSSAAIELLKNRLEKISEPRILFVGINQMISMAATGLNQLYYEQFIFANRTEEKAVAMAQKYNSRGYSLERLPELLHRADIVISCTGAPDAIIRAKMIDDLLDKNPDKKLTMLDMAIPRDIEVDKNSYENIEILDLEDIQNFVREQQVKRELAIPQAELIIDQKLSEFTYWYDHVRHEPMYNGIHEAYENARQSELADVIENLPDELREQIDRATRRLVSRLSHLQARLNEEPGKAEKH
nr:glutamyl-tRNA reductase [candidate division Zixibacteria bacterium]